MGVKSSSQESWQQLKNTSYDLLVIQKNFMYKTKDDMPDPHNKLLYGLK